MNSRGSAISGQWLRSHLVRVPQTVNVHELVAKAHGLAYMKYEPRRYTAIPSEDAGKGLEVGIRFVAPGSQFASIEGLTASLQRLGQRQAHIVHGLLFAMRHVRALYEGIDHTHFDRKEGFEYYMFGATMAVRRNGGSTVTGLRVPYITIKGPLHGRKKDRARFSLLDREIRIDEPITQTMPFLAVENRGFCSDLCCKGC